MIDTEQLQKDVNWVVQTQHLTLKDSLPLTLQVAQLQRQDRIIELLEAMEEWLPTRE